ncbi:MAG: hypothetical protein KDA81_03540 [Planctomycetaceae bacterium]|nr:hypothetical protein [Planctomycetaceae bacterium]
MADSENYQYFSVQEAGERCVIAFSNTISGDSTLGPQLKSELKEFLAFNSCTSLVVDCSAIPYLPGSVVGVLAGLTTTGLQIELSQASQDVVSMMKASRLDQRIKVTPAED